MSTVMPLREDSRETGADGLGQYLRMIGVYPVLTSVEERELANQIEVGLVARERLESGEHDPETERDLRTLVAEGENAYRRFLCCNLKLVVSVAKQYAGRRTPLLDLVQEGNIGLDRAIKKFDHRLGFKFSTYAVWWIRQSIARGLADTGHMVRVPVHTAEKINRLRRIERALGATLGRAPAIEELAADAQLDIEEVRQLLEIDRDGVSLQTPVGADDTATELGDLLEDTDLAPVIDIVSATLRHEELHEQLGRIPRRQASILSMRYGLSGEAPMTFDEAAKRLGLSRERVRQLEARGLKALRESGLDWDDRSAG